MMELLLAQYCNIILRSVPLKDIIILSTPRILNDHEEARMTEHNNSNKIPR